MLDKPPFGSPVGQKQSDNCNNDSYRKNCCVKYRVGDDLNNQSVSLA